MESWDVIFWDDCVDYVPSNWGNAEKTKYMWPSHIKSQSMIREMIKSCKEPTLNGKWTEHDAVLKKTVSSTALAEEYCKQLQYESNLSQSSEVEEDFQITTNDVDNDVLNQSTISCKHILLIINNQNSMFINSVNMGHKVEVIVWFYPFQFQLCYRS